MDPAPPRAQQARGVRQPSLLPWPGKCQCGWPPTPSCCPSPDGPGNLAIQQRAPERWVQMQVCVEQTPSCPAGGAGGPAQAPTERPCPCLQGTGALCLWQGRPGRRHRAWGQRGCLWPPTTSHHLGSPCWGLCQWVGAPEGLKTPCTLAPVGLHTPAQNLRCLPARSYDGPAILSLCPGLTATRGWTGEATMTEHH